MSVTRQPLPRRHWLICLGLATATAITVPPKLALAQANAYLCVPDYSTGYSFDPGTGTWRPTKFQPSERYLVRRVTADDVQRHPVLRVGMSHPTWGVYELGNAVPLDSCEDIRIAGARSPYLACEGSAEFDFNFHTLRFQIYFRGGYVNADQPEAKDDTPFVEIGRCTED